MKGSQYIGCPFFINKDGQPQIMDNSALLNYCRIGGQELWNAK